MHQATPNTAQNGIELERVGSRSGQEKGHLLIVLYPILVCNLPGLHALMPCPSI